jgi:alpha-galactosidase
VITVTERVGWGPQFTLTNQWYTYVCAVLDGRFLVHVYWGPPLVDVLDPATVVPLSAPEYLPTVEVSRRIRFSLEMLPQEYPAWGTGDGRPGAFDLSLGDGTTASRLEYQSHEILEGPVQPEGMPVIHHEPGGTDGTETGHFRTLRVRLKDPRGDVAVDLFYVMGDDAPALVRWCRFLNTSGEGVTLQDPASASVDISGGNHDLVTLAGAWGRERHVRRQRVSPGRFESASRNGASGHKGSPFLALAEAGASEQAGLVRAMALAYSGNYRMVCDTDQFGVARVRGGVGGVTVHLEGGAHFDTPPAVLVCSRDGYSGMSDAFHRFIRRYVVHPRWRHEPRKVLINSWEAMYFDVTAERIVELARRGREIGAELLVLDDGWFSRRRDDTSSLGEWVYNRERFPDGIGAVAEAVRREGLGFGLWLEPEMVSPGSALYRERPNWIVGVAGRDATLARNQLVLDLSNPEVVDYLEGVISEVLTEAGADYVKWDMNRNLTEAGSPALPAVRQGEMMHRYILGLYELLDRLTRRFPDILFEGCAGGGGRMDLGLAYHSPRFWSSDQTDAVERLPIQYGTSLVFPPEMMGAHVSAVPNHQVGRITPAETRVLTALPFSFGFELDPGSETADDLAVYRRGSEWYKSLRRHFSTGRFVRLAGPLDGDGCCADGCYGDTAWMVVAGEGAEVFVFWYRPLRRGVRPAGRLRLPGVTGLPGVSGPARGRYSLDGVVYEAVFLETVGIPLPQPQGDYQAVFFHLTEVSAATQNREERTKGYV